MKKFFYVLMASIMMLTMASCNRTKTKPVEPVIADAIELNTVLSEDSAMLENRACDFLLASMVLNGNVDTLDVADMKIVECATVYQAEDSCYIFRRVLGEDVVKEVYNDRWMECMPMVTEEPKLSVKDALEVIHETNTVLPASDLVALRRPLYPPFYEDPMYAFGSIMTGFVYVNANTGEIINFSTALPFGGFAK